MLGRETNQRHLLLIALPLCILLSLVLFQRRHPLFHSSYSKAADGGTTASTSEKPKPKDPSPNPPLGLPKESIAALSNETLGFEKVFVINLESRTDKLDAMRLSASLSGFNFEVIKGNLGKDIPEKALPGPVGKGPLKDNIIGCWRSHLDFAHTIVDKRLSSALVFEDDADWDVSFRSLLQYFALGSQMLLSSPANEAPQSPLKTPRSPYGDGWDLLWLGHCASHTSKTDNRRFVISNDPSTTPPNHRTNFGDTPDMSPYDNTTRIVFVNEGGTCLYSYALSYRGAQKMIFYNSMNYQDHPIDFGINDLCKLPERNFKCVGIFPQIVDNHRAAGMRGKDSDISKIGETQGERKQGFSYNIVTSVRMNAGKLIDGDMDGLTSQWAEELPKLEGGLKTRFE